MVCERGIWTLGVVGWTHERRWGEKAARLGRAVEHGHSTRVTPLIEHILSARCGQELHLPNKGGRSRASCPMDGAIITVKYLLIQIPTINVTEHWVPGTELNRHP